MVERTVTKITYPASRAYGGYERVTYADQRKFTNFTAVLTATFSYSVKDKKVSCVSKYVTYKNGSANPIQESLTDTGKGRTCTVKFHFSIGSAAGNAKHSMKMKCDYKGNFV